ncbi:MAG: hypothetical protein U9Q82_08665, partial [Chloroflexota bacterium]|nr:hypothetical protein [Chloroflexota bacterium]
AFDVEKPKKSKEITAFGIDTKINDLAVWAGDVYLATEEKGLIWIKSPNADTHSFDGTYTVIDDDIRNIIINEGYAYLGFANHGIRVLDISNIDNIKQVGKHDQTKHPTSLSIYEEYLFVADGREGVQSLRIDNGLKLKNVGEDGVGLYETPGRASLGDVFYAVGGTTKGIFNELVDRRDELSLWSIPDALIEISREQWKNHVSERVERVFVLAVGGAIVLVAVMIMGLALTSGILLPIRVSLFNWNVFYRLYLYLQERHGPVVFAESGGEDTRSESLNDVGWGFVRTDVCSSVVLERRPFVPGGFRRFLRVIAGQHPRERLGTSIIGAGIVFTRPGEVVRGVADLRKHIRLRLGVSARTRDGIEVKCNVFALATLGQDPDKINVAYVGDEIPENLRVVQLKLRPPQDANISPYSVQYVDKLEDILDLEDQREIHRFVQSRRGGTTTDSGVDQPEQHARGWRPFQRDERRVFAAILSRPYDVLEEEQTDWQEIVAHTAVEVFRNLLAKETFDSLYAPNEKNDFRISWLKNQVRARVKNQGILAYQFVERKEGRRNLSVGDEWHEREIITYPVQELKARKVLRSRGIKVITVGFTDLQPSMDAVQKHYLFENWRASWEKEAIIVQSDYELQAMRIINHARAQAQRDIAYTLSELLAKYEYSQEALALRVFQALETVAADPATRRLLPKDTIYMMRHLRSILLPGEGRDENRDDRPPQ